MLYWFAKLVAEKDLRLSNGSGSRPVVIGVVLTLRRDVGARHGRSDDAKDSALPKGIGSLKSMYPRLAMGTYITAERDDYTDLQNSFPKWQLKGKARLPQER